MRTRSRRNVGCPTAAVMRRTWRFLPSTSSRPIQQSGTLLRKRMGGVRGKTPGAAAPGPSACAPAPGGTRHGHGLRLQPPRPAGQRVSALNHHARAAGAPRPRTWGCAPLGPNIRVRAHGAGAAGVRSNAPRRSTAAALRNPRPAGRWDRHFSENRIPPARGWATRRR